MERIASIILAAGRGTRMNSASVNKVTLPFRGKPMVQYGVEVVAPFSLPIVVVVGAFADTVREALNNYTVIFAEQKEQFGTGHAVKIGLEKLAGIPADTILVGYADHMMFYKKETVEKLLAVYRTTKPAVALLTTTHNTPNDLAWGRIVRDQSGDIIDIVEQRDATEYQKQITELNAGFYCFNRQFLEEAIPYLAPSPITHEYYINHIITTAVQRKSRVVGVEVDFVEVGIGINKPDEILSSEKLHESR